MEDCFRRVCRTVYGVCFGVAMIVKVTLAVYSGVDSRTKIERLRDKIAETIGPALLPMRIEQGYRPDVWRLVGDVNSTLELYVTGFAYGIDRVLFGDNT